MDATIRRALSRLGEQRAKLSRQQVKTIRGQILSGDAAGALRGLERILGQMEETHEKQRARNKRPAHRYPCEMP